MKNRATKCMLTFAVCVLLAASAVRADAPKLINYPGMATDTSGNPAPDGSYSIAFTICDASTGGSSVWSETQSAPTTSGLFSVLLGAVNPIEDTLFNAATRYLGITIGAESVGREKRLIRPFTNLGNAKEEQS